MVEWEVLRIAHCSSQEKCQFAQLQDSDTKVCPSDHLALASAGLSRLFLLRLSTIITVLQSCLLYSIGRDDHVE